MSGFAARAVLCLVLVGVAGSGSAEAQASPIRVPTRRVFELSVGATLGGPVSIASADATLTRPDGNPLTLFHTATQFQLGVGAEISVVGFISRWFGLEGAGSWMRQPLKTEVTDDYERAPDVSLTETVDRLAIDGAVVVMLRHSRKTEVFMRAGGGWMQELTDGATLAETGTTGTAGIGMTYWFRDPPLGRGTRMGLRLDARVLARSGGVTFGSDAWQVGPVGMAGLAFGF